MQETRVQCLVWQDPTCLRAAKLMRHSYWACALEPRSHSYWAHALQLLKPECSRACALQQETPPQRESWAPQLESSPHSPQLEKSPCSNEDPAQPKINTYNYRKKEVERVLATLWPLSLWRVVVVGLSVHVPYPWDRLWRNIASEMGVPH